METKHQKPRRPKIHSASLFRFSKPKPPTVEARRTAEPLKLPRRGVDWEPRTERSTTWPQRTQKKKGIYGESMD